MSLRYSTLKVPFRSAAADEDIVNLIALEAGCDNVDTNVLKEMCQLMKGEREAIDGSYTGKDLLGMMKSMMK